MLDDQIFGIYRAIVTDTSCFLTTGKIKTRISAFNSGYSPKNLLDGYDSNSFKDTLSSDILTDIMLPFGGGSNYGMFKLPPVNSVGLVAFIDASRNAPIWIGATANSLFNGDNKLVESDFPSDSLPSSSDSENSNNVDLGNMPAVYYDSNAEKEEDRIVYNLFDENAFIIKTKTNTLPDFKKPETMNWTENPVQNVFIMSATKISMWHRIDNEGYQEFSLFCDEEKDKNNEDKNSGYMKLEYYVNENQYKRFVANNDSINIVNKNNEIEGRIEINDNGEINIVTMDKDSGNSSTGSEVRSEITMTSAHVKISTGGTSISMSRNIDRQKDQISITTNGVIQISANKISLGPDGYSFVVSPNPKLNFTLEDGSMLTTTDNLRV